MTEAWMDKPFTLGEDEPVELIDSTAAVMSPGSSVDIPAKLVAQELEMVILRACAHCGGRTELRADGAWCATCDQPAVSHDIGLVNAQYDLRMHPLRALHWRLVGRRRSLRRLAVANAHALTLSGTTTRSA